jgi:ATP-dependent DNA helicase RecG
MTQEAAAQPAYRRLGRVASLGPQEPWQVALLLPEYHDDLVEPVADARTLDEKEPRAIALHLASTPRASFGSGKPKVTFGVRDSAGGEYRATIFGDTREWMEALQGVSFAHFLATAKEWNGALYLTISEKVEDEWVGRMRPRYPARRQQISPEDARSTVLKLLPEAIPKASTFWRTQLERLAPMPDLLADVGAQGWTLEQLLLQAHVPESAAHADHARAVCKRLAALGSLLRMHGTVAERRNNPIDVSSVARRIEQLPFAPTNDQRRAIAEIARRLSGDGAPSHVCLAGDVGVGKTMVAAVLCAAVADAPGNRRALVLSPNTLLAEQLHREFSAFFPDLDMRLVTGDTPSSADLQAPILIGTSALLHRLSDQTDLDFVVLDEQHRWSRAQREQHVGPGTHLLELSATPIPRTQALMRFGRVAVVEMRDTPRPKSFYTTLYEGGQGARALFDTIAPMIRSGDVLLVVYPKREASSDEDAQGQLIDGAAPRAASSPAPGGIDDRHSIERAKMRWESAFPGRVATLTSDDDDATKTEVLDKIRTRQAQILLCTTVVEVGINLPNLYRIVIVCPERHGLMALHQLRGRTARNGGEGFCELLCPEPLNDEQREKLQTFASTTDGFALADYDMRRRGAGDLAPDSERQSGADNAFLFGTKLDVDSLDEVAPIWRRWTDPLSEE